MTRNPDFRLKPSQRIKRRRRFLQLQDIGQRLHSKCFLVSYAPARGDTSRLGIVVTKKIDKRAVVRNKLKRYIREIVRHVILDFERPLDLVIVAKQGAVALTFPQAQADLMSLLARIIHQTPSRGERGA